jgi:tetratricopeptide (TPR) repeat protein
VEASPAAAMKVLAPYLATEPDDPYALGLAAQALIGLGENRRSLEMSRRAAQLNPDSDWPVRLQALAHRNLGNNYDAHQLARRSVQISPGNWQTHFLVGNTDLWAREVGEGSMAAAEKARELAPDEPDTHNLVGQIALAMGKNRLAVRSLEQALRLDPENSVAQHELARAHLRRWRLAKSVTGFLDAGRLDPSMEQVRINLHALAIRTVLVLHWTIFGATFVGAAWPPVAGALVLVIVLGALLWARRRGGQALRRFAASLPRQDPYLVAWAGVLLLAAAMLVVRGVLTIGRPVGAAGDDGLGMAPLGLVLVGAFLSRFRHRWQLRTGSRRW